MDITPITVYELNNYIKERMDEDEFLNNVYIKGEISNCKLHYTGHIYFTLKDDKALVKCIMFKSDTVHLNFMPKDGMKVIVLGRVSTFVRDGVYQIYVKAMKEDGCNKAALGHHREDVVDTFLLSLLYEGRLHTFQPITDLSDIGLTVIRPLIYCPEKEIIDFKNRYQIPILHNTCPEDGYTKRQEMDDLLRTLNKKDHLTTTRILTAIQESGIDGWHPGVNYRTQKREK